MKFNYKKIASIFASAVMLSSTMGFAAAVTSYPAPFIQSGALNGAIVVGSPSAQTMDTANAADLTADLNSKITVSAATAEVTGGESYQIKRQSTFFHLGDSRDNVIPTTSAITYENLPTLLKDGTYSDAEYTDFSYTQKLNLGNISYSLFLDSDYKEFVPTLGVVANTDLNVLNYTLEFNSNPTWDNLEGTDLEILGKTYYISDITKNSSITLLDSATTDMLSDQATKEITVGGKSYSVTVSSISETKAYLTINGESVSGLGETQSKKLKDGSFVGVRSIIYSPKESGVSKVEISIGSGKLKITNGSNVEINEDSVDGLVGYIDIDSDKDPSKIRFIWTNVEKDFLTEDNSLVMPGFQSIKLSYGGLETSKTPETIIVRNNGDEAIELSVPLKGAPGTIIPLLYGDADTSLFQGIGSSSEDRLKTETSTTLIFNGSSIADSEGFVVSYANGKEAESYVLRATNFIQDGDNKVNKATIQQKIGSSWVNFNNAGDEKVVQATNELNIGNVALTVSYVNYTNKTVVFAAVDTDHTNFNTLYTAKGMKIWLPYEAGNVSVYASVVGSINFTTTGLNATGLNATGHNASAFNLVMTEADKDGSVGLGKNLTVKVGWSSDKAQVLSTSGAGVADPGKQDGDATKVYVNYIYSPLATKVVYDKNVDNDFVTVTYGGEEASGNFFITSSSASLGGGTQIKVFTDGEQASFKDMNLIVIGGSCVNTVALKLIDSTASQPICGEAFTAKTTVPNNKYIIKTYASPYNTAKVATLVAGYNTEDTKAAIAAFKSGAVKTDVGVQSIGPALGA